MTSFLPILILIIAAAIGVPIYLKKKKAKTHQVPISSRQNKDEVWKTIKQFLKDNDEYGKEIYDSYVAKRNGIDYINPNDTVNCRTNKKFENRIRDYQFKKLKKENKNTFKPIEKDLYVVCFQVRDTKTKIIEEPRAIECEVVNIKIDKKNWDRKILINGELDYEKEINWIGPLRSAEELKTARIEKQRAEEKEKKRIKAEKSKEKAKNKKQKK